MLHNENISLNTNSIKHNFHLRNKDIPNRKKEYTNDPPSKIPKIMKNKYKEISPALLDFSNKSTKKIKSLAYQIYNSTNKSKTNKKQGSSDKNNKKIDKNFNFQLFKNYDIIIKLHGHQNKNNIKKLFNIQKDELTYEIDFFCRNPEQYFNYDIEHEKDNNSNYIYITENFMDILLLSIRNKLILNKTIKPLKNIQKEITFPKRNILISWLTEINMKYIKDQNILFLSVKFLDLILYKQNLDINDFQLIGILCLNLALKLEQSQKVFNIKEIIALTGNGEIHDDKKINKLERKIKNIEMQICDILNFDLLQSTSILILHRLIQIMNISDKNIENIFLSISYFFLELSLYEEQFYLFDEFTKALSCILITKLILQQFNIKLGFHFYLRNCANNRNSEVKNYFNLCQNMVKNLKQLKYGRILFSKYQMKNFNCVLNTFLNGFINECLR